MASGQHFLKLGHKGRADVYQAAREYLSDQFPAHLLQQKGLQVKMDVKDIERSGPPEMLDVTLSDSDEGAQATR